MCCYSNEILLPQVIESNDSVTHFPSIPDCWLLVIANLQNLSHKHRTMAVGGLYDDGIFFRNTSKGIKSFV